MATVEPSVPPAIEPMSYASRADGPFTVPGVPDDSIPGWLHRQLMTDETDEPAGSLVIQSSAALLQYVLARAGRCATASASGVRGWTGAGWPSSTATRAGRAGARPTR
jgi:hypothetical protein